ncbi:MAG: SIS domain-containing protein [Phototrophicaceae bacterium]
MHRAFKTLETRYPILKDCINDIDNAYQVLHQSFDAGGKLLICGNGGSAADSGHIVGELMKGFLSKRPIDDKMKAKLSQEKPEHGQYIAKQLQSALPAISLNAHSALASAINNDIAGDMVFAQQVYGYGRLGDSLLGISTSGNSSNVLYALHVARTLGLHTIGLTGRSGGEIRDYCDVTICVPYEDVISIQELHLPIYHAICVALESDFFDE